MVECIYEEIGLTPKKSAKGYLTDFDGMGFAK